MDKPPVWQMIKEAVTNLGGKGTYPEIKEYIKDKYDDVNQSTINAQLIVLSVNQPSRVHYPENKKPRISNTPYDALFSIGRGQVVKYDPLEHGTWEIYQNNYGGLGIRQITVSPQAAQEPDLVEPDEIDEAGLSDPEQNSPLFPLEAHLRDFLITNLSTLKTGSKLTLYQDPTTGRDGKEFPTDVGRIDILTTDEQGNFIVFELKLSRGPDKALGQLLRYMGWVKKHLAAGKQVRGIIVASKMDTRIKYAVTITPDVSLYEYELKFDLNPASL